MITLAEQIAYIETGLRVTHECRASIDPQQLSVLAEINSGIDTSAAILATLHRVEAMERALREIAELSEYSTPHDDFTRFMDIYNIAAAALEPKVEDAK